jgi:hypothetical protein
MLSFVTSSWHFMSSFGVLRYSFIELEKNLNLSYVITFLVVFYLICSPTIQQQNLLGLDVLYYAGWDQYFRSCVICELFFFVFRGCGVMCCGLLITFACLIGHLALLIVP